MKLLLLLGLIAIASVAATVPPKNGFCKWGKSVHDCTTNTDCKALVDPWLARMEFPAHHDCNTAVKMINDLAVASDTSTDCMKGNALVGDKFGTGLSKHFTTWACESHNLCCPGHNDELPTHEVEKVMMKVFRIILCHRGVLNEGQCHFKDAHIEKGEKPVGKSSKHHKAKPHPVRHHHLDHSTHHDRGISWNQNEFCAWANDAANCKGQTECVPIVGDFLKNLNFPWTSKCSTVTRMLDRMTEGADQSSDCKNPTDGTFHGGVLTPKLSMSFHKWACKTYELCCPHHNDHMPEKAVLQIMEEGLDMILCERDPAREQDKCKKAHWHLPEFEHHVASWDEGHFCAWNEAVDAAIKAKNEAQF